MVADGAADAGPDQPVMSDEMSGDATNRGTAEATGLRRLNGGDAKYRDRAGNQHHDLLHDQNPSNS